MPVNNVDFDAADLVRAVEQLTLAEIDALPFGVIALDRFGVVQIYNDAELKQSGYGAAKPLGLNFFQISFFGKPEFQQRLEGARAAGKVDLEIGWYGDYSGPKRSLRIRVQSGQVRDLWMFIQRDGDHSHAGADSRSSKIRVVKRDSQSQP